MVIDTIFEQAKACGFSNRDICLLLALVRVESGFNPDAAAGTSSAAGLGQLIKETGKNFGLTKDNIFEIDSHVDAFIRYIKEECFSRANKAGLIRKRREIRIYAYHHDGPSLAYGGEVIAEASVMPWVDKIYDNIDW